MSLRKLLNWKSALIYTHRWVGIVLTLVFVLWFFSGIVFIYYRMPALSAEERLQRMEPLNLSALQVTPAEAAAASGLESPSRVRVAMDDGRPVYRFQDGNEWRMVYADTGEVLRGVDRGQALALMRRFAPEHAATMTYDTRLADSDQWTLQSVIRSGMPMHRIAMNDAAGTEYYVSEETGEPVMQTTASGRIWGYLGPVFHWLYFTPLRRNAEFWNSFVVWSSLIGTVMCAMGIAVGIWRYSVSSRFRLRREHSHTPYASWMKWHHYAGLIFGLFGCTWAFSGALSLNPFSFLDASPPTKAYREAATGGPIDLSPLTVERVRAAAAAIGSSFTPKELDFFQFRGEPYFVAYRPPAAGETGPWRHTSISDATALFLPPARREERLMVSALRPEAGTFHGFDRELMPQIARAAMPGVPVQDSTWLTEYDSYYYDQKGKKPLPVLRVRYADPQETWLYLDPSRGVIASRLERATRWDRWLYHGLHSLDFPFLYYKRPLWDIVVILLSIGGIAISVTSALPAYRRLIKHGRRWFGLPATIAPRAPLPARRPASPTATARQQLNER